MTTSNVSPSTRRMWRGSVWLMLLFSLAIAPAAHAEFNHSTIAIYAPGAPAGAWVSVQWQDQLGHWHDVEGWQSPMAMEENSDVVFKQWAVYAQDYGRGPFRWIIYTEHGGSVWATSPLFHLPDGDGASLTMTVTPKTLLSLPGQSTITVYAPNAPARAWVSVQWQDQLGLWHDVEGWQSEIDRTEDSDLAFQEWGVQSQDFGHGPFRWVIYTERGGHVWATSPKFYLPNGNDARLTMTLAPKVALIPAETMATGLPTEAQMLAAQTSVGGLNCGTKRCNFSLITVYVPDAPAMSKIGVQWQDGAGLWHDVRSWQGDLDLLDVSQIPFKSWTITSGYGTGPFRWVIYNEFGDAVWGVSPSFSLPGQAGLELSLHLSPADMPEPDLSQP